MSVIDFFDEFLNLIYKKKCLICSCSKDDNFLCKTCSKDVQILPVFAHRIYKNCPIYSAYLYQGIIKDLIHKFKFHYKHKAKYPLSRLLWDYFKKLNLKETDNFTICYPNIYHSRKFLRGYDHTKLVCMEFSKLSNIPFEKDTVLKIRHTKPQYKMKNIKYRKNNIKGSFKINPKKLSLLKNKTILLIDDITTSGATLEEIIDEFIKNDIKSIICLTIAKP